MLVPQVPHVSAASATVPHLRNKVGSDNVNAEDCFSVGTALQKELGGKSFIDKFRV